jgi:phosphoglycerate dehydrogenase-like enzyme
MTSSPRVALVPEHAAYAAEAVVAGGGVVVGADEDPDALVWTVPGDWDGLGDAVRRSPGARWVALPYAGVEGVVAAGVVDTDRTWTCAKGVYSEPVAEHALALALAGLRRLDVRARATTWGEQHAVTLYDAPVTVLGAGGITEALAALLAPFRCPLTVVRHDASTPFPGAVKTLGLDRLADALPGAKVVVLALALTPETTGVIGERELGLMDDDAWLVNVGRGKHVDTDALVAALRADTIGGAALDVTDPEPLPDGHPLWELDTCLVTPHTANPWSTAQAPLGARIAKNVRRFGAGEPLVGLVDPARGY